MVPYDVYVASLARKRMAAAALFRDQAGQVLLVDPVYRDTWGRPELPEGLIIIYDGGTLTDRDIRAIRVPPDELAGFALVPPGQVADRVAPGLARQLSAALAALASGTVAALEDGRPST
jgi:8-oxo-dGTP diphosphatase